MAISQVQRGIQMFACVAGVAGSSALGLRLGGGGVSTLGTSVVGAYATVKLIEKIEPLLDKIMKNVSRTFGQN